MKYIIPDLPPSDNMAYLQRGKMRFMTKKANDWKKYAGTLIKSQYKKQPKENDTEMGEILFYLKRERDIQGSLKLFFDAFEGILYINDKQIKKFGPVFKYYDKDNPRIEFYF